MLVLKKCTFFGKTGNLNEIPDSGIMEKVQLRGLGQIDIAFLVMI